MQRARVQKAEALKTKDLLPQNKSSSCKHPPPHINPFESVDRFQPKKKKEAVDSGLRHSQF